MEQLGFVFELLLLALGVYMYLFARGVIKTKDPERKERVDAFRKNNAGWMRLLGLALAAVMLLNVVVRVKVWMS